jgi:hypothetical protein
MANAVYPKWKDALLLDLANATLTGTGTSGLYAVLVDTAMYAYNPAHEFYSSLAGVVSTPQEVTSITVAAGVVDGDNVTYLTVPLGPDIEAIILFRKNSGADTTWRLVAYLDQGVTGLPVTPNGGDIAITWNAAGIFGL